MPLEPSNLQVKTCPKCKIEQPASMFSKANRRDGLRSWCKGCERIRMRTRLDLMKEQVFDKLGHECKHCGFDDKRALQIDHVRGGGNQEHQVVKNAKAYLRKVIADNEDTYQILCANCNWIKRHERLEVVKEDRLSEEGRQKLSFLRRNWTPSDETRKKMSDSHIGQVLTEEHKEKLKLTTTDSWTDPEIRAKRIAGIRAAKIRRAEQKVLVA